MRHIIVSTFLLFLIQIGFSNATGCPTGYSTFDNSTCYKVVAKPVDRGISAATCAEDGGALASVPNGFVNAYIYQLAKTQNADPVWLGFECPNSDISKCKNMDQTAFGPYSNFYRGNPSSAGDCVEMSTSGATSQQWLSSNCTNWKDNDKKAGYACAIPYGIEPRCPKKYAYFHGMCYHFSSPTIDQRSVALEKCQRVAGGQFATVHNADVNEFLADLELKHTYSNPNSWFGLHCPTVKFDGDVSSCYWDDGSPFDYSAFPEGWPLYTDSGYCVSFNDGVWLNDMDCSVNEYFCQSPTLY